MKASDKSTLVFEALVDEIRPKVVLAHSNEPVKYLQQFAERPVSLEKPVSATIGSHTFQVLGWHGPLFSKKIDEARSVGQRLSDYCRMV